MLIYIQMIGTEEERSKFKMMYANYKGLMFYVANDILCNVYDAEDAGKISECCSKAVMAGKGGSS